MTQPKPTIAVLGAGAWGTALGVLLARNGHPVRTWGHDPAHVERLRRKRANPSLPGIRLPDAIEFSADLAAVAEGVSHFLVAVPSHAFRVSLAGLKNRVTADAIIAWASKGFEPGSGKLLGTVMDEVLGRCRRAVASGPTFAIEIARGLPAALTVASEDAAVARAVCEWLRNDRLRVYTSDDVAGVQLGGAIKNVIAIAAGISDGLGFGSNARAALITRGLAELARLGVAMGEKGDLLGPRRRRRSHPHLHGRHVAQSPRGARSRSRQEARGRARGDRPGGRGRRDRARASIGSRIPSRSTCRSPNRCTGCSTKT